MRPTPLIIQDALAIFSTVAIPFAARVRVPVVPAPASVMVSSVIAMERTLIWFTNVIAVPIGKLMLLSAGSVNVRAVLSADGCSKCLLASAARMP